MSVDTAYEAIFSHTGSWTEDDWLALPDTPARIELVSGVLVVNALPDFRHQRLTREITNAFDRACPRGWEAYPGGLDVRLWTDHVRIPDVVVARTDLEGRIIAAADTLVLVEITSPSNFRQDRITKHGEYAEAGVPFYLRVDLHLGADDLTGAMFELVEGSYREHAAGPDGVLRLTRPWPMEIDLRAMARGRS